MNLKDVWRLSKGMSFTGRTKFIGLMFQTIGSVLFKKYKGKIMNFFDEKKQKSKKYLYELPTEEGHYWFEYISNMEDVSEREPCEVYKDDNFEMVVAFIGSDEVKSQSDLQEEFGRDSLGKNNFRFQKIVQHGESGIMKKRKEEQKKQ